MSNFLHIITKNSFQLKKSYKKTLYQWYMNLSNTGIQLINVIYDINIPIAIVHA